MFLTSIFLAGVKFVLSAMIELEDIGGLCYFVSSSCFVIPCTSFAALCYF